MQEEQNEKSEMNGQGKIEEPTLFFVVHVFYHDIVNISESGQPEEFAHKISFIQHQIADKSQKRANQKLKEFLRRIKTEGLHLTMRDSISAWFPASEIARITIIDILKFEASHSPQTTNTENSSAVESESKSNMKEATNESVATGLFVGSSAVL